MGTFSVKGPFDVPLEPHIDSKMVAEDISDFWDEASEMKRRKGCYAFAIRAGRGITPLYVGKATKAFEQECFTDHKLKHYNYALAQYQKGTPVMFFVAHPTGSGKTNKVEITDIEDFLIQVGRRVNPDLRNVHGAQEPLWGIKGVLRGGKGKTSKDEKAFTALLDL